MRWAASAILAGFTLILLAGAFGSYESDTFARSIGGYYYVGTGHGSIYFGGHSLPTRYSPRFIDYRFPWDWWPLWRYNHNQTMWTRSIVLWPWWLLGMAITGTLWYRRLRRAPGHCRCGYDLVGGHSGQCPECGRTVTERNKK